MDTIHAIFRDLDPLKLKLFIKNMQAFAEVGTCGLLV